MNFVESNGLQVWRSCLDKQCEDYGLFRPTYRHLKTASDFKKACTGAGRLRKGFDYAVANRCPLIAAPGCTKISISLPVQSVPEDEESEAQHDPWDTFYLVPGGRYLITMDDEWVCMWDLEDAAEMHLPPVIYMPERTAHRPKLVVKHTSNASIVSILDIRVASNDEIHLLVREAYQYVCLVDDLQSRLTYLASQRGSVKRRCD